jgi:hypothetical protein
MTTAKRLLEELYHRSLIRQKLLHGAKRELEDGSVSEAVSDLLCVVEMLSDSEERVMRLHAECFAMLEQAGKILELDAKLRPVVVHVDAPVPSPSEEVSESEEIEGDRPEGSKPR